MTANSPKPVLTFVSAAIWFLAMVVPLIAISQQSFWIDEAATGKFSTQPTLRLFWEKMTTGTTSDSQMPLYMIYAWGCQKIFGRTEIFLRLANYPLFILGQLAAGFIWSDRRKGLLFISIAASSPFVWFYLNEGRPYIMQYAAACVLVWFLSSLVREDLVAAWKYWVFVLAAIVLAGASMLGVFWVGTSMLIVGFLMAKRRLRPPLLPAIFCVASLLVLGLYYLSTLRTGARGTYAQQSALNIPYVVYELCGFVGLGPGRLAIREHAFASFFPYLIPIGAFALILFLIFLRLWKTALGSEDKGILIATAIFCLPPIIFLSILATFIEFGVLGRHATPAAPFIFMLLTLGVWTWLRHKTVSGRGVVTTFFLLALISCLGLRFCPWHLKDDYRGAVAAIFKMVGPHQVGWWSASEEGGNYYHLVLDKEPDREGRLFLYVRNPDMERLSKLPAPDVVVLSKRDLYDEKGTIAAMLKEKAYVLRQTLPAFSIWEKPR